MPGAAILTSTAALRAGAGKVRVATVQAAALAVAAAVPELFVLGIAEGTRRASSLRAVIDSAHSADAVLIGPGMRDAEAIRILLPQLLRIKTLRAVVIDATALSVAPKFLADCGSPASDVRPCTILTPHAAEMASVCKVPVNELERDPLSTAREVARRFGSIVVLKRSETLVCSADHSAYLNKRGNVGLATAGSGDVLAGVMVGLCARGIDPLRAAVWAVSLHARAGERLAAKIGPVGYLAREIVAEIPQLARNAAR